MLKAWHLFDFSMKQRCQVIDIEIFRILAIMQQLSSTGTALSIVAMSCCILHDYVIDSRTRGVHHPWAGVMGLGIISVVQVIDIALPNGLLDGAHSYYGISG